MPRLPLAILVSLAAGAISAADARGQAPYTLKETFAPGTRYGVELTVDVDGRVTQSAEKGKPAQPLAVVGNSTLSYDERVLPADDADIEKVLRVYRRVAFRRTVGTQQQEAVVRDAVRRMVVLRSKLGKVPFSPDGPMTWGELDVVRTDIFSPALVPGLLPDKAVGPGDEWPISPTAVAELTDLEKVTAGGLTAKFVAVVPLNGRDHARISITGTVRGVDEFGPGRHKIDGTAYFDLKAGFLAYVSLKATHDLLDGTDRLMGRIDGRFTLTRTPGSAHPDLADDAVKPLVAKPTADNSQLLYDNPDLGVRFVYPRGWRVGTVQGRQLTLDGPAGAGMLFTIEPPARVPTAAAYRAETEAFLKTQKAVVANPGEIRRAAEKPFALDRFGLDADLGGDKLRMEYAVLTQAEGGVVLAARMPRADAASLTADVDRVLRKLALTKPIAVP